MPDPAPPSPISVIVIGILPCTGGTFVHMHAQREYKASGVLTGQYHRDFAQVCNTLKSQ